MMLAVPPFPVGVIAKACSMSSQHTCILVTPNGIAAICWGRNNYGQLGIGVTSDFENKPSRVALDTGQCIRKYLNSCKAAYDDNPEC